MVVGILTLDMNIDGAFSLKEKRMTVNRIRDRVRSRFNVAIAEVEENDIWNRACLGVVAISNEKPHANAMLSKVVNFVETIRDCEVEDYSIEFV